MRTGSNHFGKKKECELNEMKMRENYDNGGLKTSSTIRRKQLVNGWLIS